MERKKIEEIMNVHKALCELKLLKARIDKKTVGTRYVYAVKANSGKIDGMPREEVEANVVSEYQSIRAMIARRNAIKNALVVSNATTKVTIGEQVMTVAEAIEMKTNGIVFYKNLRDQIARQLTLANNSVTMNNTNLEDMANKHIQTMFAGADQKKVAEEMTKAREQFVQVQTYELANPIDASAVLKELDDFIEAFVLDLDSALSTSNATTEIKVVYET